MRLNKKITEKEIPEHAIVKMYDEYHALGWLK